jgi:hypothetical protein
MGFWEALFAIGLALGVVLWVLFRRVPATPVGVALVLGGTAVFGARALQPGPYVVPSGFDLFVATGAIALAGVVLLSHGRGRRPVLVARLGLALAPLFLVGTAIATIHEIGEIVTLRTTDGRGVIRETRLAFVEYDGAIWIGAGSGERRRWYQELVAQPQVDLVRGGATTCRIANPVIEPAIRNEVCRRLEEKYLSGRVAAALGEHLFLNPEAIAIRLDPCPQ